MSKGWRIIGAVVLVMVLLGAICMGVGFMTGGDATDILTTLNEKYNLSGYWEAYSQWAITCFNNILEGVRGLL